MADDKYLPIYLNDHLAAAVGGVQLARRAARANRGSDYGESLQTLAAEINEDRSTLRSVLKRLGVRGDPVKMLAPVVAEMFGRLKLNGELLRYSPLSRLEELEILLIAVQGKAALWRSLRDNLGDDPRLAEIDFEELAKRASSQRQRLERLRSRAAAEALGDGRERG
ncbi:MAG: hypothetical protein ACJ75R_12080 [Solirubrobacterales bacterium]